MRKCCAAKHQCRAVTQRSQYLNYMFTPEAFLSNLQLINTSRSFMMKLNYQLRESGSTQKKMVKQHETEINRLFIALKSIWKIDTLFAMYAIFQ